MNKFEENAVRKQQEAYKITYAKRQFSFSCQMCASRGLRHGSCANCPVAQAHGIAVQEIMSGERQKPNVAESKRSPGYKKYVDRKGHVTLVVNIHIN